MTTGISPFRGSVSPIRSPLHRRIAKSAFSLVETAIAIGIVSFAMLPMVGLVAGGLSAVNRSTTTAVVAEITHQLKADLEKSNSATLAGMCNQPGRTIYFDNEGIKVDDATASVYQAVIATPLCPVSGIFFQEKAGAHLYQFAIEIKCNPGATPEKPGSRSTKSTLLITPLD